jgi:hypothetical protein
MQLVYYVIAMFGVYANVGFTIPSNPNKPNNPTKPTKLNNANDPNSKEISISATWTDDS